MKFKIELFTSPRAKQPFYFRLKRGSKVIAQSEGYLKRSARDKTANSLAEAINSGGECVVKDLDPPAPKPAKKSTGS